MRVTFTTTIGDDIEIECAGDYDGPDRSVGYSGSFWLDAVYLKDNHINIISMLSDKQIKGLEYRGFEKGSNQILERKQELAELRYEREKDEKFKMRLLEKVGA